MTTWKFAGTSLTAFGRVTIINDYLDLPQRRGENQIIPYRHGSVFVEKYYNERTITIGIAINAASATALETTADSMKALFSRRTEGTLACTLEDSTVRNAMASIDSPLEIDRKSDKVALAVLQFNLASPYFRSGTVIADNTTTINAGTVAMNVVNIGNVEERDPVITMIGPLNNPIITNSTNSYSLTYSGTNAGTVVIQTASTGEYTAAAGTTNVIGNVTHSGGAALMVLNVGTNVMSIANTGGTTGSVGISFYAPYF